MWDSFKEYIKAVIRWWWAMMISLVGLVGFITTLTGYAIPYMPTWAWLLIMFFGFSFAQFRAFHTVRDERDQLKKVLV